MLISLHLKNFRRHESLNLSFAEGLNGLFGKNYAGKSAVLLAIGVALGGPGWARGYRLVRRGTDNFEVQLVFAADGVTYRVVRTKSGAKLFRVGQDDKLIASAQGQVNIELGKILGMPVDRWLELRFVRQKQAAQLFEAGSAKLNLLVEELTGVDTISRVIEWLGRKAKTGTDQLEALRPMLLADDQLEEQQSRAEEMRAALAEYEPLLKEGAEIGKTLAAAVDELAAIIPSKRQELDAARTRNRNRTLAENELASHKKRMLELGEAPVVDADNLSKQVEEESATLKEWSSWLPSIKAAMASHARAEAKYNQVLAAGEIARVDTDGITRAIDTAMTAAGEINRKISDNDAEHRAKVRELKDARNELESGVCTGCNRAFEGQDETHRAALADRIKGLEADVDGLVTASGELAKASREAEASLKELRKDLANAEGVNREAANRESELRVTKQALDSVKAELDEAQAIAPGVTIADAEGEVKRIEQELTALRQRLSKAQAWNEQRNACERAVQSAEAKVNGLAGECESDEDLAQMVADLDHLTKSLDERKQQVADHSGTVSKTIHLNDLAKRALENATAFIEKDASVRDDVLAREAQLCEIDAFRKYLRDNRSRYLQRAWDLILGRASGFANAVTEGYVEEIRRTEAGTFQFIEQGEEAEVTDASGAQGAILGLSVQVALAETLPTHLDVFLADEPTADMDAEHSSAALMSLSAVSKQAMVISHHRMDESICKAVAEL